MIALVLGGAKSLAEDVAFARTLVDPRECVIVACNDAGYEWPGKLDHWVTSHPDELPIREEKRRQRGYPGGYETWTRTFPFGQRDKEALCDHTVGGYRDGSSGLLAVGVALEIGCHAILCGIPMEDQDHFNRSGGWEVATSYRTAWVMVQDALRRRARSCSGWTAELLGKPDAAWVAQHVGGPLVGHHERR